jgi:rod shape determining protein RodA
MRLDRRLIARFEWLLPLLALTICSLGVATVYSATHSPGTHGLPPLAARQLTWMAGGTVMMVVAFAFDYRRLERRAVLIYAAVLLMLLIVPVIGRVGGGSRRWITLGPVSIQPSEFMKLALVIILARYFSRVPARPLGPRHLVLPLALTALPAALILAQPDLGTVGVLGIVALTVIVLGGVRLRWLALLGSSVLMVAPLLWSHLKPYQRVRVQTFLNPENDPLGAGYHVIQSMIAVGSGGLWGKGFMKGTQNHLDFLPEQHTDFIFSVFAEEWGFVGGVLLVSLYLALIMRGLVIASRARDRFGVFLVLGVTAIFFWQAVINVGMTTGVFPVVGVPLPMFSYGGSSLVCLLAGVGLAMNVSMRRYFF